MVHASRNGWTLGLCLFKKFKGRSSEYNCTSTVHRDKAMHGWDTLGRPTTGYKVFDLHASRVNIYSKWTNIVQVKHLIIRSTNGS